MTEQPSYKLVLCEGNFEIRDYSPMVLAEVVVSGERKQAIRAGFRILADYIFGNNKSRSSIDSAIKSEKIAMTAPVIQEKHQENWKVRFVMPKKYSIETLPQPKSEEVDLIPVPAKRFAVIRFSGFADDKKIQQATSELKSYISSHHLTPVGEVILAFYNPPWTLPFMRRNEVMLEI